MRNSNYGFYEKLCNAFFLLKTKFISRKARLIRSPIIIRGKKYIDFGDGLTIGRGCRIDVLGEHNSKILLFGNNVNIGDYVRISCINKIEIGNNVLIGSKVLVIDNSHGNYKYENQDDPTIPPNLRKLISSAVYIEDNVWIGENVVIQQGVKIKKGTIIAANSVVTKSIPENTIVAGVPAKIIKRWNDRTKQWEHEEI